MTRPYEELRGKLLALRAHCLLVSPTPEEEEAAPYMAAARRQVLSLAERFENQPISRKQAFEIKDVFERVLDLFSKHDASQQ